MGDWVSVQISKEYKELVKAIATGDSYVRGWSKDKVKWFFRPASWRKFGHENLSMDAIRAKYGRQKVKELKI